MELGAQTGKSYEFNLQIIVTPVDVIIHQRGECLLWQVWEAFWETKNSSVPLAHLVGIMNKKSRESLPNLNIWIPYFSPNLCLDNHLGVSFYMTVMDVLQYQSTTDSTKNKEVHITQTIHFGRKPLVTTRANIYRTIMMCSSLC